MESAASGSDVTRCLKCNLNFTSAKTLKIHQQEKHSQNIVKCFKCGLKFTNAEKFRVHWNNRHVTITKKPSAQAKPSTQVKASVSTDAGVTISDDESKDNEDDSEKVASESALKKIKSAIPTGNRCKVCYKAFSSQQFAQLHYKRVHMNWTIKCEVCEKSIKKNLYLNVHLKNHLSKGEVTKERIVELQVEAKKKNKSNGKKIKKPSQTELKVDVAPKDPTPCPDCKKVFVSQRVMKIHWVVKHRKKINISEEKKPNEDDGDNSNNQPEKQGVPTPCSECGKILSSDGRMRIHYYQAHVRSTIVVAKKKRKRTRKEMENDDSEDDETPKQKSLPIVKSISDLRSKIPDIDFDSKVCPVCKREFINKNVALKHFQNVHRKAGVVKCPYQQCFIRCSTVAILRTHFANAHPNATLPKKYEVLRRRKKKNSVEKENDPRPNANVLFSTKTNKNDAEKSQDDKAKDNDNQQMAESNDTKITPKKENSLMKMFAKMREKNANSPVASANLESSFIEIEEDQNEEIGGCFTLDFEHCSVCDKKFFTNEAAMMHYNQKHPDEMQMCAECGMLITHTRQMIYHFKTKHPMVEMPVYLKSSRSNGYRTELFDLFSQLKCTVCKRRFKSISKTQHHFIEHHDLKFDICSVCDKGFRSEPNLLSHWAQKHPDLEFIEYKAPEEMEVDDEDEVDVSVENEHTEEDAIEVEDEQEENQDDENENEGIENEEIEMTKDDVQQENENDDDDEKNKMDESNQMDHDAEIDKTDEVDHSNQTENFTTIKSDLKVTNVKSLKRVIYPFIIKNNCPICSNTYKTRQAVVQHYKVVHLKRPISCTKCLLSFANVDHVKQHWLVAHEKSPWNDLQDEQKMSSKNDVNKIDKLFASEKISKYQSDQIPPNMNVVVSLINIKDDLDSLSPAIRSRFLKISKEIINTTTDPVPSDQTENIFVTKDASMDPHEEMILSQNEPLDLSISCTKMPSDDCELPIDYEAVNIKYESSADLIDSFGKPINIGQNETNNKLLLVNEDVVIKDEIIFEESQFEE